MRIGCDICFPIRLENRLILVVALGVGIHPNERVPIVIDLRKLAAVDIAFLGSRLILTEFSVGALGSLALGVFTLLQSHSAGGIALGSYLLCIGINYVPLLL